MDTADLTDAVRMHRAVEIVYRGDAGYPARVVHPHAIYRSESGGLCMDAVQIAGPTNTGRLPSWRQFHLMKIIEARVLDAGFETAWNFNPGSDKYQSGLIASA